MTVRCFASVLTGLLGATLIAAQSAAIPTRVSQRLGIGVTIQQDAFKIGAPVILSITIKNFGSEPVRIMESGPEYDYELTVFDESGKEPARTELGEYLLHEKGFSSLQLTLQPQEERHVVFQVTKIYQLTKPGSYIARLQRVIPATSPENAKAFVERAYSAPIGFKIIQ